MKKKMCLTANGRLLDHIGISLYSSYEKAVSELVINGFDSDAENVDITIDRHAITIKDDGTGMSLKDIENYCLLGGNTKRAGRSKTAKKRLPVGSKGIGKIAGFAVARLMKVTTCKNAERHTFLMDKDRFTAAKSLADATFDVETARGRGAGTTIELSNFLPHILRQKLDVKKLRAYLAREIPRQADFRVTVNGEVCAITDIQAKRRVPVDLHLPLCGHVTGTIIVAKKPLDMPGITITVRGRSVGRPAFFGLESFIGGRSSKIAASKLIAGEVEVPGFDPEEDDGSAPVILSSRESFKLDHPKYLECQAALMEALKAVIRDEAQELDRAQNSKTVKEVEESLSRVAKMFNACRNDFKHLFGDRKDERYTDAGTTTETVGEEPEKNPAPDKPVVEPPVKPEEIVKPDPVDPEPEPPAVSPNPGRVQIGPKTYSFAARPLGEDSHEIFIDEDRNEIVLNSDHPTMAIIEKTKPADYLIYRMIVAAVVAYRLPTAREAYNTADAMLRRPAVEFVEHA